MRPYELHLWQLHCKTLPSAPSAPVRDLRPLIPRREADILQRLCQHQGEIVPIQNILLDLWGSDDFFNARSLQVLITRLRGHLSHDPRIHIINVRGRGYKLLLDK